MFYAQVPSLQDHQYQSFYFTQRQQDDEAWSEPQFVTETTFGVGENYMRNRMAAQNGSVFFLINCNYNGFLPPQEQLCPLPKLELWSYSPANGLQVENLFAGTTIFESTSGSSLLLSTWQNGVYAYWEGNPNGYNMRRKPFAISGAITERTLLTGNNWVSGQAAIIDYYSVVDALPNSITNVLNYSWLNANGTLNAQEGARFQFGEDARLNVYGSLNAAGTQDDNVVFTLLPGSGQWTGITIATGVRLNQLNYCTISAADIGISASYSRLNIDRSTITDCLTGLSLYGMTGVKYYCNLTNSQVTVNVIGAKIEGSHNVIFTGNQINFNNSVGMEIIGSSPKLYFNEINSNFFGVWVQANSNPRFGDYVWGDEGKNRIENNAGAEICSSSSTSPAKSVAPTAFGQRSLQLA